MCLQYPIGRLSDRYDRRLVILLLGAVLALLALLMVLLPAGWREPLMGGLVFLLGGMAFSIYPLSLSHACDELRPDQVLGANQGLLLAYSLGAMTGPLLAPLSWRSSGQRGCSSTSPSVACCWRGILAGASGSGPPFRWPIIRCSSRCRPIPP